MFQLKSKILVVDDQPGIRLLLSDVFMNKGYCVSVAQTGKEALDKIYRKPFDLIMLDYRIPIINGQEIIKQMEHDKIVVPIILMSGLIENIKREFILDSMVVEYIAKPFNIQDVCKTVKDILSRSVK